MDLIIKNGRVVDPSQHLDDTLDLRLQQDSIVEIARNLKATSNTHVLDAAGLIVAPGFVDMHVHLREPGLEEAETIETGARAAAAGGFTAVACMPNTTPANDSIETTEFILQKAKSAPVAILPVGAITKRQFGEELADLKGLHSAGVLAFSDDGKPVFDSALMRKAMETSAQIGTILIDHCEDPYLFRGGAMNEGRIANELGIRGIPSAAEEIMVARNILLSKLTGAAIHLAHLSTAGSMDLLRWAKANRLPVTAEVTPHHFTLTEEAVAEHGTNAKMNPPLRSKQDLEAVLEAITDGTVDVVASDHAPHPADRKSVEFHEAAFGIIGLETSVSLGLHQLVYKRHIGLARFIELYSLNPARLLKLDRGIRVGAEANLTVFDPLKQVTIDASLFQSKSRNTPFDGWSLQGAPVYTICKGKVVAP